MRGRKPRSTEEKLARGETRPSRVNYAEPDVAPPEPDELAPPKNLKGSGRTLWLKHARVLVAAGKLRGDHMPLFLQHCRTDSDIESWEKQKRVATLDLSQRLSIERVLNQLKSRFLREAAELGMSPVSNSKVRTVALPPVKKPSHERFFGKGGVAVVGNFGGRK